LTLSRLEATAALPLGTVDLSALVEGIVAELAPLAEARQQRIELHAPAACAVRGDSTLLSVLVRNLVDNAIRYSPARATVRVAVTEAPGRVLLRVDDSGPGLHEDDMKRMGERFFRVVGTAEDGSGLGWSIVRRIAAAQHAEVRVNRSKLLGGLSVEVEWLLQETTASVNLPALPKSR
jgi:two-component system sensor histidine kinase QseC